MMKPMLVVHGGCGTLDPEMLSATREAIHASLRDALRAGHAQLQSGAPAVDAVAAAVVVLEDSPHFNAGRGAVFTHEGCNELDASIMEGASLRAGAVAGVRRVRNPVLLARAVMEHSGHVLLVGEGAEAFAASRNIPFADPGWFHTAPRWREWQDALASTSGEVDYYGTVGAVARDCGGGLAAATSTGGMTNKRWGRVGDSPLIGAGTYANAHCAVSGTGWGEFYIRASAAHSICLRVAEMGASVNDAAELVVNRIIPQMGGSGGAIVLGADGSVATPFNTRGMHRGWIAGEGEPHTATWRESM